MRKRLAFVPRRKPKKSAPPPAPARPTGPMTVMDRLRYGDDFSAMERTIFLPDGRVLRGHVGGEWANPTPEPVWQGPRRGWRR